MHIICLLRYVLLVTVGTHQSQRLQLFYPALRNENDDDDKINNWTRK